MEHEHQHHVELLSTAADRLDELADTAELMGDAAGASDFRAAALGRRMRAMELLDGS